MESILGLICYVAIGGADIFQISVIPAVSRACSCSRWQERVFIPKKQDRFTMTNGENDKLLCGIFGPSLSRVFLLVSRNGRKG